MSIILRTHGGLGNQIFQILFGRIYSKKANLPLKEIHDTNYYHSFGRSTEIATQTGRPNRLETLISDCRIPKILERIKLTSDRPVSILGSTYLDGYFQNIESYSSFADHEISDQVALLASELGIERANRSNTLVHLRIGDFFESKAAAISHVTDRLKAADYGSAIMTNDEEVLQIQSIRKIMQEKKLELVKTHQKPAEDVLRLMARHKKIDANDSTLVFWSSVFAGCQAEMKSEKLRKTQRRFIGICEKPN